MRKNQLQNAVKCSETMLKDAKAGNWEKVYEIEVQRSELLGKLFSSSNQEINVDDMDDKIRKIIAINKKLEEITVKARANVHSDIISINKGRQAVNLYAQNTL